MLRHIQFYSIHPSGFQNSRNEVSVVELKVSLPGQEDRKISTVLEGSKYQLTAKVQDYDCESLNTICWFDQWPIY